MFFDFVRQLIAPQWPVVKADEAPEEDMVDPLDTIREECREKDHAKHLGEILEECTNRVNSKKQTTETCQQELYDWLHAVDHCVAGKLFQHLK